MTSPPPNVLYCSRCRSEVSWPAQLDGASKAELAALARESRISAIRQTQHRFDLSLGDAKNIVNHISRSDDVCIRCKHLVVKGEAFCVECRCLNLNW